MLSQSLDVARIQAALDLLTQIDPDRHLYNLKKLVVAHGGFWAVPEDPTRYQPVMYEITLFDVPALADTPNDLPKNWIKAAQNTLAAARQEQAA